MTDEIKKTPEDSSMNGKDTPRRKKKVDYSAAAAKARKEGNNILSIHLYLAEFGQAIEGGKKPTKKAIEGLKRAWDLAYADKERSMAEYIFELMSPYLTDNEMKRYSEDLSSLTLSKLGEYGMDPEDLESMTRAIAAEIGSDARGMLPSGNAYHPVDDGNDGDDGSKFKKALARGLKSLAHTGPMTSEQDSISTFTDDGFINYDSITGFKSAIEQMRKLGIGEQEREEFQHLVSMLNSAHGLNQIPAMNTVIIQSESREDGNRFMVATLGEIQLPTLHMKMEETYQGFPVLCVSGFAIEMPRDHMVSSLFDKGAVLVLEDLDLWESPFSSFDSSSQQFFMMQAPRGAREAINLITAALNHPEVYVIATCANKDEIDPFFLDLLEPYSVCEISNPTPEERIDIWLEICRMHPSLSSISKMDLVRLSANMSRDDIYMAVWEAIDEAYKLGLESRRYIPVSRNNLFEKLAAYQSLDSKEYSELEDEVVKDFKIDLSHLDDLLP